MRISEFQPNQKIIFSFRGKEFYLFRDNEDDPLEDADWYMIVTDMKTGYTDCDGWINNSEDMGLKQAIIKACEGCIVEPPKYWGSISDERKPN